VILAIRSGITTDWWEDHPAELATALDVLTEEQEQMEAAHGTT
jgi:hypothetical protein